jgi:hypothetical protein
MYTLHEVANISSVIVPFSSVWAALLIPQQTALPGTHIRSILTTTEIILAVVNIGLFSLLAILELMLNQYLLAFGDALVIVGCVVISRRIFDDDNWFSDLFKKLKRGFKSLREKFSHRKIRIHIAFPSPLPSPA